MPDESVRLRTPMPACVAYLTAEPAGRGVQYAKDVYSFGRVVGAVGGVWDDAKAGGLISVE